MSCGQYALLHTAEEDMVEVAEKFMREIQKQFTGSQGQRLKLPGFKQSNEILQTLESGQIGFLIILLNQKMLLILGHKKCHELFHKISELVRSKPREQSPVLFVKYQINDEDFDEEEIPLNSHVIEYTSHEEVARYSSKCMIEREATESEERDSSQLGSNVLYPCDPHSIVYQQVQGHPNIRVTQNQGIPLTVQELQSVSIQEPMENSLHFNNDVSSQSSSSNAKTSLNTTENKLQEASELQETNAGSQQAQSEKCPGNVGQQQPGPSQCGTNTVESNTRMGQQPHCPTYVMPFHAGNPGNVDIVDPSYQLFGFGYPARRHNDQQMVNFAYPASGFHVSFSEPQLNIASFDLDPTDYTNLGQSNVPQRRTDTNVSNSTNGDMCNNVNNLANTNTCNNANNSANDDTCNNDTEASNKTSIPNRIGQQIPQTIETESTLTQIAKIENKEKLPSDQDRGACDNSESSLTGERSFVTSYVRCDGIPGTCLNCNKLMDCLPIVALQPSFNSSINDRFSFHCDVSMSSKSGPQAMPCLSGFGYCSHCIDSGSLGSLELSGYLKNSGTNLDSLLNTSVLNSLKNDGNKLQNEYPNQSNSDFSSNNQKPEIDNKKSDMPRSKVSEVLGDMPRPNSVPTFRPLHSPLQQPATFPLNQPHAQRVVGFGPSGQYVLLPGYPVGTNNINKNGRDIIYARNMLYNISGPGSFHNSGESETDNTKAEVSTKHTQTDNRERLMRTDWGDPSGGTSFISQQSGSDGASASSDGASGGATGPHDHDDRSVWDLSKKALSYVRDSLDFASCRNWQDVADKHKWSYGQIHQLQKKWERRQIESPFLELVAHFEPYTVRILKEDLMKIGRKDILQKLQRFQENNELFAS